MVMKLSTLSSIDVVEFIFPRISDHAGWDFYALKSIREDKAVLGMRPKPHPESEATCNISLNKNIRKVRLCAVGGLPIDTWLGTPGHWSRQIPLFDS